MVLAPTCAGWGSGGPDHRLSALSDAEARDSSPGACTRQRDRHKAHRALHFGLMRLALFLPCFNDTLFPRTGIATVRLLERLGHTVEFPEEQTCCGQIHFNTGYRTEAARLMRRFVEVFGESEVVVAPSASCVGMVREFYPVLARESGDGVLLSEVTELIPRVFELSELLVGKLGVEEVGARFPHHVAFHPTCHSTRVLDVGDGPLKLLAAVEGLELVELPEASECCGFGGTFSVKNSAISLAMLADKLEGVEASGAEVVTAVDNSCLMNIEGGLMRRDSPVRVLHLAEILASDGEGLP